MVSRDCPRAVLAFPEIFWICVYAFPQEKRKHINNFEPHPVKGIVPKNSLCLLVFDPPYRIDFHSSAVSCLPVTDC